MKKLPLIYKIAFRLSLIKRNYKKRTAGIVTNAKSLKKQLSKWKFIRLTKY